MLMKAGSGSAVPAFFMYLDCLGFMIAEGMTGRQKNTGFGRYDKSTRQRIRTSKIWSSDPDIQARD
ncbi:MAG TPA: hypothetical protein DEF21_04275 [Thalassospira lucentensis]|uniref:Uncharacterized protein n=1 Tax=Thalassospira lucentensis TaxID=168935 RepID=A0A358HPJ8_9PROT|nr:hypothetical protein [Thalassospira lucentensis]